VDDAMKFVQESKGKLKMSVEEEEDDDKESKEPNYDNQHIESEQEKNQQTRQTTINQTF
jgi:hypothetical protein